MSDENALQRPRLVLPESGTAEEILALLGKRVPDTSEQILEFAQLAANVSDAAPRAKEVEQRILLLFRLSGETYALPIEQVHEILRVGGLTRVPGAPRHVRGVMNVRGRILPVVELRTRITLGELSLTESSRVILVEVSGKLLGLLVDKVADVVRVPSDIFSAPPVEVVNEVTDYVSAVGRLGEQLVLLVDLERAMRLPKSELSQPTPDSDHRQGNP